MSSRGERSTTRQIEKRSGTKTWFTYSVVRIQARPINRSGDRSELFEWIIYTRLTVSEGFGDTKVNDFDSWCIFKHAENIFWFDIAMHNSKWVYVPQRIELQIQNELQETFKANKWYTPFDPRFEWQSFPPNQRLLVASPLYSDPEAPWPSIQNGRDVHTRTR